MQDTFNSALAELKNLQPKTIHIVFNPTQVQNPKAFSSGVGLVTTVTLDKPNTLRYRTDSKNVYVTRMLGGKSIECSIPYNSIYQLVAFDFIEACGERHLDPKATIKFKELPVTDKRVSIGIKGTKTGRWSSKECANE